jgi:hypothetical protein
MQRKRASLLSLKKQGRECAATCYHSATVCHHVALWAVCRRPLITPIKGSSWE